MVTHPEYFFFLHQEKESTEMMMTDDVQEAGELLSRYVILLAFSKPCSHPQAKFTA